MGVSAAAEPEAAGTVADEVAATAYLAAACRAEETRQARPLLRDEYAELFIAEHQRSSGRRLLAAGRAEVVARTVLIDRLLAEAVAAVVGLGEPPVIVNIGAGFCARPYRLDLSSCRLVVEWDTAASIALKQRVLAGRRASCPVRREDVDLRDRRRVLAELRRLDADAGRVIVVTEGVLVYLPAADLRAAAATLAAGLTDAAWLTDVVSVPSALAMGGLATAAGAAVELHGLPSLDPLEVDGWRCVEYRALPAPARKGPLAGAGAGMRTGAGNVRSPAGAPASRRLIDGVVGLALRRH
jgi:O-methyltransferase involved in polyketide biosynthesis